MPLTTPTAADSSTADASQALLRLEDLQVTFRTPRGRVCAVDSVDLHVDPGEVLAVVGESGSGKSVSMLATMGLLPGTATVSGSIRLEGTDLLQCSARHMRQVRGRDIAMVFQDPMSSLNPVHTIGKQVEEVLLLHTEMDRRARRDRAIELLDRVGIPAAADRVDSYPHEFSGGMRQRAMIAIALACDPKLLIADEPTTALDVTVQSQIIELVRTLQADTGMSVVWITHDLGVVAELADRVAVMYSGRVVETGPATRIYNATRHPYTSGLLRSIPRLDRPVEDLLPEIPGSPPTRSDPSACCAFAPRCPAATTECHDTLPVLQPHGGADHLAACLHTECVDDGLDWQADRPAVDDTDRTASPPTPEVLVEMDGVAVHFPVRRGLFGRHRSVVRAVDGVDLRVHRGRTLGIVGESGCGKTTLGRTLVGLIDPTDGEVRIEDQPLSTKPGRHRRRVQMIFQDPFSSMNPGMRVRDIVAEPIRIHRLHPESTIEDVVSRLLQRVGIVPATMERHPHEFSGGQRQRIAIARALAAEPEVIVCDEAVSSLDVSVQAQIVNLLRELQLDEGLAFVFVAHDLAVVRQISHEVAVMYLGQVVEQGPRDALYANPLHPYTRALLDAVPSPEPGADDDRVPLQGDLPSPSAPPAGCRFHTRCPLAVPGVCDTEAPALREAGPDRRVACHLVDGDAGGARLVADSQTPPSSRNSDVRTR